MRGGRAGAFSPPGKTEAQRGLAPRKNRVRARRGEEKDTVRELPAAGALLAGLTALRAANRRQVRETLEKPKEQSSAFQAFLCVGGTFGPTFYVFMEVLFGLLPGGFPPGRREQGPGLLLVRENRSATRACTWNQPRACETWGRKRHGARLARRSRATCPPQVCPAQPRARNQPRACAAWCRHKPGARLAHRRRATCPAQPRDLLTAGAGFLPARENRSRARARTRNQPRACAAGQRNKQGARLARRSRANCSPQVCRW